MHFSFFTIVKFMLCKRALNTQTVVEIYSIFFLHIFFRNIVVLHNTASKMLFSIDIICSLTGGATYIFVIILEIPRGVFLLIPRGPRI